jgi:hypothetical protein
MIAKLAIGILAATLPTLAAAQNSYPTAGGGRVPAIVVMCVGGGLAIPCVGAGVGPANVFATAGGATVEGAVQMCLTGFAIPCAGGSGGGSGSSILPADRDASANWRMAGMLSVGGIPNLTTQCGATVSPRGGGLDDTANIQAAISACPPNQVVQLSAGTFTVASTANASGIGTPNLQMGPMVLRGMGPTQTILNKPNGATLGTFNPGPNPSPIIDMSGFPGSGTIAPLTVDAMHGDSSVHVSNASAYHVGEILLLDEASGAAFQPDHVVENTGQIFAAPDYRVAWNIHNPSMGGDDDMSVTGFFQVHADHPTSEIHQISGISGNTITFDSPLTISYRVSHGAQVMSLIDHSVQVGVEELALSGGDSGNITLRGISYSWLKHVESTLYLNGGIQLVSAFRSQLEQVYVHNAAWPVPGGAGYNISVDSGSSEILIQNSISVLGNKVIVMRAAGAGSVVAYNYMDKNFIGMQDTWVEIGQNASHLSGPHHVLFEGNWCFNADSDQTHGNAIYMTHFRNWLTGFRTSFTDYLTSTVINDAGGGNGPMRAGAAHAYAYWHSFIGNVLGTSGQMTGWVENGVGGSNTFPPTAIWTLGVVDISPQGHDPTVVTTTIRDGNWDYVTNSQKWFNTPGQFVIPASLYLSAKPAFFGANPWPWVNPATGATFVLPAKARYDAGMP